MLPKIYMDIQQLQSLMEIQEASLPLGNRLLTIGVSNAGNKPISTAGNSWVIKRKLTFGVNKANDNKKICNCP
jgi:hypothetical protein